MLSGEWNDVDSADDRMRHAADPTWSVGGAINAAERELWRGRSAAALGILEAAVTAAEPSSQTAWAHIVAANILLERNEPALAARQAERALHDARERGTEPLIALGIAARAHARAGRQTDSANAIAELTRRLRQVPGDHLARLLAVPVGWLAIDRGAAAEALDPLTGAEERLPANPAMASSGVPVVPVWFALGSAHLRLGHDQLALARFERIVNGVERVHAPIEYARSLQHLASIHERRGDRTKAAEYYRRFLDCWKDGDLDRDLVEAARTKLTLR